MSGSNANDEFVELFNPTDSPIDIGGYRLSKETSGGSFSNLVTSMSGIIPSHGYFLVTPVSGFSGSVSSDLAYSTSSFITDNNTIILYSDAGQTIVDKVGFGSAINYETAVFPTTPPLGQSIERISNIDTDNNSLDFRLKEIPDPHNSTFIEPPTPSPTESPSPTPTLSPTPSQSPTETSTPQPSGTCRYKVLSDIHYPGLSPGLGYGLAGTKYTGEITFSIEDTAGLGEVLFNSNEKITPSFVWNQYSTYPVAWTDTCNPGLFESCISHLIQSGDKIQTQAEPFILQYAYYDPGSWGFVEKYLSENTSDLQIVANGTDVCVAELPTPSPSPSPTPTPSSSPINKPPGWSKSHAFTCTNQHIPQFVYTLLKLKMPEKFSCN